MVVIFHRGPVLEWWTLRDGVIRTAGFHLQKDDEIINYNILVYEDTVFNILSVSR